MADEKSGAWSHIKDYLKGMAKMSAMNPGSGIGGVLGGGIGGLIGGFLPHDDDDNDENKKVAPVAGPDGMSSPYATDMSAYRPGRRRF